VPGVGDSDFGVNAARPSGSNGRANGRLEPPLGLGSADLPSCYTLDTLLTSRSVVLVTFSQKRVNWIANELRKRGWDAPGVATK